MRHTAGNVGLLSFVAFKANKGDKHFIKPQTLIVMKCLLAKQVQFCSVILNITNV